MQVVESSPPSAVMPDVSTKQDVRYLQRLAVLLLVIYLAGFALVYLPGYERWSGSAWGSILDYAFQTADQNADVVIFGDSSALFAVDTLMLSKQLDLKVINLPNTIGGLPVTGDMALRRYLNTNRPPRLIVFYFSKWDLDYKTVASARLFEGEEILAHRGSWQEILQFSVRHPQEFLSFPLRIYSGLGSVAFLRALLHSGKTEEVVSSRGHVINQQPFPPLTPDCELPSLMLHEQRTTSVSKLQADFTTPGIQTMIYLAPVPNCRNVDQLLLPKHLAVAPPAVFAAGDFTSDTNYAHLKPNAVPAATTMLARAVESQFAAGTRAPVPAQSDHLAEAERHTGPLLDRTQ